MSFKSFMTKLGGYNPQSLTPFDTQLNNLYGQSRETPYLDNAYLQMRSIGPFQNQLKNLFLQRAAQRGIPMDSLSQAAQDSQSAWSSQVRNIYDAAGIQEQQRQDNLSNQIANTQAQRQQVQAQNKQMERQAYRNGMSTVGQGLGMLAGGVLSAISPVISATAGMTAGSGFGGMAGSLAGGQYDPSAMVAQMSDIVDGISQVQTSTAKKKLAKRIADPNFMQWLTGSEQNLGLFNLAIESRDEDLLNELLNQYSGTAKPVTGKNRDNQVYLF